MASQCAYGLHRFRVLALEEDIKLATKEICAGRGKPRSDKHVRYDMLLELREIKRSTYTATILHILKHLSDSLQVIPLDH